MDKRTLFPSLFHRYSEWLSIATMAKFVSDVCSLCKSGGLVQVSSRGMSSFFLQFALGPLLLSVDLKIAFWFLNDRKQSEEYFGISVIFIYFFTKVHVLILHFVKTINSNINIQLKPKENIFRLCPSTQHHLISSQWIHFLFPNLFPRFEYPLTTRRY